MEEIKSVQQFNDLIQKPRVIVMFTANWCPDCFVIKPFLPQIVAQYTEFEFYSVNRDELMELCEAYDIFGIPSFVAFGEGNELGRFVSKDRKTRQEIENFIQSVK
ncbi:MAG TPA: thiol reductase thioredoxin [Firmicutes bacterium]|nr:thiol reductase thioredoxin [Bacillota bacterium]